MINSRAQQEEQLNDNPQGMDGVSACLLSNENRCRSRLVPVKLVLLLEHLNWSARGFFARFPQWTPNPRRQTMIRPKKKEPPEGGSR
jgi:hypothetical protein